VYRRARQGVWATLALLVGFFGVLSGTEAAYYTLNAGPSGDDFTGMVATLGGFVLLVVGAVTLWRSRRTDDRRLRRYLRRSAITAGALALAAVVLFPTAIAYVVTHTARAEVPAPNLGAAHEQVAFTTSDGLRLQGWFVPSQNGATVIAFPGRSGPQKHTRMLIRHGYGVLLFDRRGEGASDGDPNAFGWVGDRDLHAAAAYLRSRPDVDPERIGAIGLSVGGEMLVHAAAHSDAFKAIVSEGASGQSARDGLASGDTLESSLGGGVNTLATAVFTSTLPPPRPEERGREHRTECGLLRLRRERAGWHGGEAEQAVLRGRPRAEADLGGPGRPAHRRNHHLPGRVRTSGRRFLRPDAARAGDRRKGK
jgi:uncharacterized protein